MPVLGTVHTGAPHFGLTGLSWTAVSNLAPLAAVVALVVITQTAATTRAFAEQGDYDVDAGRDFLAVGAGSILAGLVGSFPVDASPPRTGAVVTAGGRTQAGALGAAAAVLLFLPFADVLKDLPLSMLAAVLIFVAFRLFKWRDLVSIARFDLFEFALAAVTLLVVVLVGVEQGIAVAVGLAILDRIRLQRPAPAPRAGPRPGHDQLGPGLGPTSDSAQVPGVLVVLFATPLWYANAVHFRDEVVRVLAAAGSATTGARSRHHRHVGPRLHRQPRAGRRCSIIASATTSSSASRAPAITSTAACGAAGCLHASARTTASPRSARRSPPSRTPAERTAPT